MKSVPLENKMRINSRFFKYILINAGFTVLINLIFRLIPTAGTYQESYSSYQPHENAKLENEIQDNEFQQIDFTSNNKRTAILLLASYRSGSSLTGEIFNKHDEVLYFFGKPAYKYRIISVLKNIDLIVQSLL